jgi:hypothetical protein
MELKRVANTQRREVLLTVPTNGRERNRDLSIWRLWRLLGFEQMVGRVRIERVKVLIPVPTWTVAPHAHAQEAWTAQERAGASGE